MTEILHSGMGSKAVAQGFAPLLSARLHVLYDSVVGEDLPDLWRRLAASAGSLTVEGAEASSHGDGIDVERPSGLRILLVEDDGLIRLTCAALLRGFGHQVHQAADGEEALALLDGRTVDLLITDVNLTGFSGVELARQALARAPTLRVIFATGLPASALDAALHGQPMRGRALLMAKPYGERELRRALDAVTRL